MMASHLGSAVGVVLGSTLGAADGITLGIDEKTELSTPDDFFDGSNERSKLVSSDGALEGPIDCMLEGSALGFSLGTPVGLVIGSDGGIILGSTDVGLLGSALVTSDGIKLKLGEDSELSSLDGCFDGSNDGIPEDPLLEDSHGSDDGTATTNDGEVEVMLEGSALGVPLGSTDGEVLGSDDGISSS